MPSLPDHAFLGYDPDTGNGIYYPALPLLTAETAWYDLTDNQDGPAVWSHPAGARLPSVYVKDVNGDFLYIVAKFPTAAQSHRQIAMNDSIYNKIRKFVAQAGYPSLNGDTFLNVGGEEFRLVIAQSVADSRYDLIAFQTLPELSEGDTVLRYTTPIAIVIKSDIGEVLFPAGASERVPAFGGFLNG